MISTHFFSLVPVDRQFDQVGTLPLSCRVSRRAEGRALGPMFEIGRVEDNQRSFIGQHGDHDPLVLRRVPEDIRIAEVGSVEVGDGIARVVRPGPAAVVAEGNVLFLPVFVGCGVDGDQARVVLRIGILHRPLLLFQSTTALPE